MKSARLRLQHCATRAHYLLIILCVHSDEKYVMTNVSQTELEAIVRVDGRNAVAEQEKDREQRHGHLCEGHHIRPLQGPRTQAGLGSLGRCCWVDLRGQLDEEHGKGHQQAEDEEGVDELDVGCRGQGLGDALVHRVDNQHDGQGESHRDVQVCFLEVQGRLGDQNLGRKHFELIFRDVFRLN